MVYLPAVRQHPLHHRELSKEDTVKNDIFTVQLGWHVPGANFVILTDVPALWEGSSLEEFLRQILDIDNIESNLFMKALILWKN